jgi:hypothetical protein
MRQGHPRIALFRAVRSRYLLLALSLAVVLVGAPVSTVGAQNGAVTVVAEGLRNPRQMEVGPDDAVYVAEAGKTGKNCADGFCFGFTSRVTKISSDGTVTRAHKGLLSLGEKGGFAAVGADDIAISSAGKLFAIMAWAGPIDVPAVRRQSGKLLRLRGMTDRSLVANVVPYELKYNPAGREPFSNPYGVVKVRHGWAVVDAGANTLLGVDRNGVVHLIEAFRARTYGGVKVDSVPTSVAVGPDGAYYVGELGGEAMERPQGESRVWRVVPGQQPTVYATGFDTIVALNFGPDGSLYVVELLSTGFAQFETDDFTGSLWRIPPGGGEPVELAEGQLELPGGVAVTEDGQIYVSTNSLTPDAGQVVRIDEAP